MDGGDQPWPLSINYLGVNQWDGDPVVVQEAPRQAPELVNLLQHLGSHVVVGDPALLPGPADDGARPDQRHPILGVARLLVHGLDYLQIFEDRVDEINGDQR